MGEGIIFFMRACQSNTGKCQRTMKKDINGVENTSAALS